MKNSEYAETATKAAEQVENIALKMLLLSMAQRLLDLGD